MRARPPEDNGRRAFTLMELIVVLTIISILGAVLVPAIVAGEATNLSAAAQMVVSDLHYVQSLALAQAGDYKVEFDVSANEYRGYAVAGDGSEQLIAHPWQRQGRFGGLFRVRFDAHSPCAGVRISAASFGGQPWVRFGALGEPHSPGCVELKAASQQVWILVYAGTGALKVTTDPNDLLSLGN